MKWDEKDQIKWDELKWSASMKYGVQDEKNEI